MLYHISKTAGLKKLKPQVSTHKKPYVYAIENVVTGLLFGAPHDDFDFIISEENGIPVIMEFNKDKFLNIINDYQGTHIKHNDKIGTLSEKNTHMILKKFICEDETFHEIKVGSYFADVLIDNHIYEIQTANFNKLRDKLHYFLQDHKVTIIYPLPHIKYLQWINQETGEILDKSKERINL